MLTLQKLTKSYQTGDTAVQALKGITLQFRESEFVAVLGQSGSGKTTLLNIIGGLDTYTTGDLLIQGISTKNYKDQDWDAYRNYSIGFVFQSYNLIAHISVLANVEMALTLSGVSAAVRKKKATEALIQVGLKDHINKKPNQLSGGQMQRVAIARALVNDPKIILADEPTGALDSETSVEIMNLLQSIAKDKLIIMVTHNNELAHQYSNRVIQFSDGKVIDDSNAYDGKIKDASTSDIKMKKTAMSFLTALSLSFKNLTTKKARTLLTAFAGSIGIVGIALVLALSNGFNAYITQMQKDTLSGMPLTISQTDTIVVGPPKPSEVQVEAEESRDNIRAYDPNENKVHTNNLTDEYLTFVNQMDATLVSAKTYAYAMDLQFMSMQDGGYSLHTGGMLGMEVISTETSFLDSQYNLVAGSFPQSPTEIVVIVDENNRLSQAVLEQLGIEGQEVEFTELLGSELKVLHNNQVYNEDGERFVPISAEQYGATFESEANIPVSIVGVMSQKNSSNIQGMPNSTGIGVPSELVSKVLETNMVSDIARKQVEVGVERNVLTGLPFVDMVQPRTQQITTAQEQYEAFLQQLGAVNTPTAINIYPVSFEAKDMIVEYLESFNEGRDEVDQVIFTDLSAAIADTMNTLIGTITVVLVAFAAISLVVSSVMIGIITYVSVVERTKEIGVLRSLGARKKDIARVFNAETLIIGFVAGMLGIGTTVLLTIPINMVLSNMMSGVGDIAVLNPVHALILVGLSMGLTLIAGLLPANIAAKKNPVTALRTE